MLRNDDVNVAAPPYDYNPSSWKQRIPICVLATIAAAIATYMALYQWRLISDVWDPVFGDQTKRVLDSKVSEQMRYWMLPLKGTQGWGFGSLLAGQPPNEEQHFRPSRSWKLRRITQGTLANGPNAGVPCASATDAQIISCIQNTLTAANYQVGVYDCTDWVQQAAAACCLSGGGKPIARLLLDSLYQLTEDCADWRAPF